MRIVEKGDRFVVNPFMISSGYDSIALPHKGGGSATVMIMSSTEARYREITRELPVINIDGNYTEKRSEGKIVDRNGKTIFEGEEYIRYSRFIDSLPGGRMIKELLDESEKTVVTKKTTPIKKTLPLKELTPVYEDGSEMEWEPSSAAKREVEQQRI